MVEIKKTKLDEIKKPKSNKWIVVGSVILVMALILIISFKYSPFKNEPKTINDLHSLNLQGKLDEDKGYIFNGYSFVTLDNIWYSTVQIKNEKHHIALRYGPKDLEDIPVIGKISTEFNKGNEIFISFNPNETTVHMVLATGELSQTIAGIINKKPTAVCDRNTTKECANIPIITCEDPVPVIYEKIAPGPRVELKGSCVTIIGEGFDIVKAADRVIYSWLGIM